MVCKMVKRGVLGAALGAGALALLFGTAAPSYVKTAFCKARQAADDSVPVQFKIDAARQQLRELDPAIERSIEALAAADFDVEKLHEQVIAQRDGLEREKVELVALRRHLDSGDLRLTKGVTYSEKELKSDLARRFDRYQAGKKGLAANEETLKLKRQSVKAAKEQLDNMKEARQVLLAKIDGIEAKLRAVEAKQAASAEAISFDDSALARVKTTVGELEKRVEVMDRVASYKARLTAGKVAVDCEAETCRDVAKEIDAEFGAPAKEATASADKNL